MKSILVLVALFGIFENSKANAAGFTFGLSNCSGVLSSSGACGGAVADALASAFNLGYSDDAFQKFLTAAGNANAVSSRNSLAPGVIGNKDWWVGVSVGAGVQLPETGSTNTSGGGASLPGAGVGAQTFLTLGLGADLLGTTLGLPLDPKRLTYALSFGTYDFTAGSISYDFMHVGLGASYQMVPAIDWVPAVSWQGLRLTTGFNYLSNSIAYSSPAKISASGVDWNSTAGLSLDSTVFTIPTEVVTGIQLLWFWNLYTGVGADFNFGSSKINGSLTGPVTVTGTSTSVGTATATTTTDGVTPTTVQLRYLLGTQFDFGPLAWHVHASYSNPRVIGINTGLLFAL